MKTKRQKKKLKIAILHLAFVYSGGGERLVLEEARGLAKRGHKVSIFSPVVDRKSCFPEIIDKYKVKALMPNLPTFVPQREAFQVLLACALAPFLAFRFKGFEVILAANQPSLWLALWAKKFFGVPYVAYLAQPTRFLHPRKIDKETKLIFAKKWRFSPATFLIRVMRPLGDSIDRLSIKRADLVLANGKYAKSILEKTYKIAAISCPAGAYPSPKTPRYKNRFLGRLRVTGKVIQKPYILLTNRHFPQKRFEYALSALPAILKKYPSVPLVITGGRTEYTEDLKNLVKQLSLEGRVVFLGLVEEKNLKKLYGQAAVYVYTAPEEDFGMGMVEAMACGTPVVAWERAGPTGIVEDGKTGFLAKPFEVADFADKILKLLGDKRRVERMGREAWRGVKSNFSYEGHIKILEERLKQVTRIA